MQPIFTQYSQFLKDKGCDVSWFREGLFWLDRNMVKGFLRGRQTVSLYRVRVDDDLSLSLIKHKENVDGLDLESWAETTERLEPRLRQLEADSIALLRKYGADAGKRVINTNSTGKDSMVVTHLAQKAGLRFDTYFNVTTLDVAESNRMARRNGYIHIYPNPKYKSFYSYLKAVETIPNRLNRFCCQYFKERPTIDYFADQDHLIFLFGMRNQESNQRAGYQDTTVNPLWGGKDWIGVLPIRTWTELDVWLYTLLENIEINDKYRYGYGRVGCGIACPYYTKYTWVLDQYWYPKMFRRWRDILRQDFISKNK